MSNYLGKYAAKAEPQSEPFKDMFSKLLPFVAKMNSHKSFVSKCLNRVVGERDWSAQEVYHLLLGRPLVEATRQVVTLDCRPDVEKDTLLTVERSENSESLRQRKSALDHYKDRPVEFEDVSLLEFLQHFEYRGRRVRRYVRASTKPRVVDFFPRYNPNKPEHTENFAHVRLMLHHPFRSFADLLVDPRTGASFNTFHSTYQQCKDTHVHPSDTYSVELPEPDEPAHDSQEVGSDELAPAWADSAEYGPCGPTLIEDNDDLGNREVDRAMDWSNGRVFRYRQLTSDYWEKLKDDHPAPREELDSGATCQSLDFLQHKQRLFHDLVLRHYMLTSVTNLALYPGHG